MGVNIISNKSSKNYVCPRCWQRIEHCTCDYAPYNLIMIDEALQEAIRTLNYKGYYTEASCAGHYYKSDATVSIYISFYQWQINIIPEGWKHIGKGIYYFFIPKTKAEFKILQTNEINKLLNWINQLEAIK